MKLNINMLYNSLLKNYICTTTRLMFWLHISLAELCWGRGGLCPPSPSLDQTQMFGAILYLGSSLPRLHKISSFATDFKEAFLAPHFCPFYTSQDRSWIYLERLCAHIASRGDHKKFFHMNFEHFKMRLKYISNEGSICSWEQKHRSQFYPNP